jgi:hypothetical protein
VKAVLYDVEGRRIESLLSRPLSAGSHRFQLDSESLGAATGGVYLLRVEAEGTAVTRKLVLTP